MSPSSPINGDNVTTETRKRSDMSHSVSPPNAPSSSSAGTGKRKRSQSASPEAPGTRKRSKSVSSDEGSSKSAYVCSSDANSSGEFDDTSASDSKNSDLDRNGG